MPKTQPSKMSDTHSSNNLIVRTNFEPHYDTKNATTYIQRSKTKIIFQPQDTSQEPEGGIVNTTMMDPTLNHDDMDTFAHISTSMCT